MEPMTLSDFLLARIAEDEAMATAAVRDDGVDTWDAYVTPLATSIHGDPVQTSAVIGAPISTHSGPYAAKVAKHIARWDPARVLAECKTKRWIVELHHDLNAEYRAEEDARVPGFFDQFPDEVPVAECAECSHYGWHVELPCPTLRLLALPYVDHPQFQPEWRV